jgi:hypothetical protein
MQFILKWFRMTCRDTSPIISEMMDHRVSSGKYWRAKIHLAMCKVCQHYKVQLEVLARLARELGREDSPPQPEGTLSPEAKARIKNNLNHPD